MGQQQSCGQVRAKSQLDLVWQMMSDRQWHTLAELAEHANCPQASASARLRDLRKPEFGGRCVERQYFDRGLFRYRIVEAPAAGAGRIGEAA
jgi:hypothetical protein